MKRPLAFACAFLITGLAMVARAVSVQNNTLITLVEIRQDGRFLITLASPLVGNRPGCATATSSLSGDATTAGGKALLEGALSAFTGKKAVNVRGAGKCNELPGDGVESLNILQLE